MARLIVDVHVSALNGRQLLELDLEILSDVVGNFEALVAVNDNVDLGNDARAAVVGADGVDALNGRRVCHGCMKISLPNGSTPSKPGVP